MRIQRFEDIIAWQKARALNLEIYNRFKDQRNFAFRDQIFRASLSTMNNIAEGFERGTDAELKYFLTIARGSNAEVKSMLFTALDFGYIAISEQQELSAQTNEVARLLTGFIKKLIPVKLTVD